MLCYVIPFLGLIFFPLSLFIHHSPSKKEIYISSINLASALMGLFFSRNLPFKFCLPFLFSKRVSGNMFPKQLENMMCLVARTGRHLQRYDDHGCRQVVGSLSLSLYLPFLSYVMCFGISTYDKIL